MAHDSGAARSVLSVAALYDIHGNFPALEAVLRALRTDAIETVVVGGDVAWGPFPRETVELLMELDGACFVRGNADREVAARAGEDAGLDRITAEITEWAADQLSAAQLRWLESLSQACDVGVDGLGDVLFCHGSPRSDEESITPATPRARLEAALGSVRHPTVVCGHTHMQFELALEERRVVNAGSVGLPYQRPPAAYWAALGPDVDLRRTDYDLEGAASAMEATRCPHVREVFVETILAPPDPGEVAAHLESIEEGRSRP